MESGQRGMNGRRVQKNVMAVVFALVDVQIQNLIMAEDIVSAQITILKFATFRDVQVKESTICCD